KPGRMRRARAREGREEDADAKVDEPVSAEEATVDDRARPPSTTMAQATSDQSANENVHEAASEDVPALR
ncbi:hypothetical protein PUNSTDRAFT_56222, partial [Punctularia strigosozonata HHB-11173 SS5]